MFTESDYNEADLARSLLFAISNDIGQIACLYAMMHNLKKVLIFKINDFEFMISVCYFNYFRFILVVIF